MANFSRTTSSKAPVLFLRSSDTSAGPTLEPRLPLAIMEVSGRELTGAEATAERLMAAKPRIAVLRWLVVEKKKQFHCIASGGLRSSKKIFITVVWIQIGR